MSLDDGELREIGGGVIGQAPQPQGAVVRGSEAAARVGVGGIQNEVADFAGRLLRRNALENCSEPCDAKFYLLRVFRFENAIGGKQYDVARTKIDGDFVIFRARKKPESPPTVPYLLHFAVPHQN